jgi:hypothetical protein
MAVNGGRRSNEAVLLSTEAKAYKQQLEDRRWYACREEQAAE